MKSVPFLTMYAVSCLQSESEVGKNQLWHVAGKCRQ